MVTSSEFTDVNVGGEAADFLDDAISGTVNRDIHPWNVIQVRRTATR